MLKSNYQLNYKVNKDGLRLNLIFNDDNIYENIYKEDMQNSKTIKKTCSSSKAYLKINK